ncbi:PREDICTED: snRNA-activating protein complex subunit 5, partial [Corvus brachyrhynchos]|uniref:snRNA-activating protein complex subunit 5 n=1 Tax=Corvus brachyrhynchos TaxID=85066 RepID=UPI0008163FCE
SARSDQCRSLQVEELALQSMIRSSEENVPVPLSALAEDTQQTLGQMDNEAAINQTELHLSLQDDKEEEEEESDS